MTENKKYTHAAIIPLIGGEAIAQSNVFESDLDYILSYEAFAANDSQYRNYLEQHDKVVPYKVIDSEEGANPHYVDVVSSVCPCAGLSRMNLKASADSATNDWMYKSTAYVLEHVGPQVLWGENAPGLVEKMGAPVLEKLKAIGKSFGYTLTTYRTKTLLHGYPQVRNRSFYFFTKGDRCLKLPFFKRDLEITIHDLLLKVNDQAPELACQKLPTDEFFYNAILHLKGMTHTEYIKHINAAPENYGGKESRIAFFKDYTYEDAHAHVARCGEKYANYTEKLNRQREKEKIGGVMYNGVFFPQRNIGAFISRYGMGLCHPIENRFISIKESLAIMAMPDDFELVGGRRNFNMICQNVPVGTATDMANAVKSYLDGTLDTVEVEYMHCHNVKQEYMTPSREVDLNPLF